MAQFDTKHGTLTIQFFYHDLIGSRLIELRTDAEQIAFVQCADHHVQSFIIKAGNDVERGMSAFWKNVFLNFNRAITEKFKDADPEFKPIEDLLNAGLADVFWTGEGFSIKEAP